jgi:hypothetical protein
LAGEIRNDNEAINVIVLVFGPGGRRRRVFVDDEEMEIENFASTGAVSGTGNVITQTTINLGDAVATGGGSGNSVTND